MGFTSTSRNWEKCPPAWKATTMPNGSCWITAITWYTSFRTRPGCITTWSGYGGMPKPWKCRLLEVHRQPACRSLIEQPQVLGFVLPIQQKVEQSFDGFLGFRVREHLGLQELDQ